MNPGNSMDGVLGPDALAGLGACCSVEGTHGIGSADNGYEGADVVSMPRQGAAGSHMQTKTVSHSPQGVDDMFTRPHLIHRPGTGDRIDYYGHPDMSERPVIYPETAMAGMGADGHFRDRCCARYFHGLAHLG